MIVNELKRNSGEVYLKISYDEQLNCVIDEWQGSFGTQENFRIGLEKVVDTIREKKCENWLANLSGLKGSFDSSNSWLAASIMTEAAKAGIKNEAIILPKNIFAKLSAKDAIRSLDTLGIRINSFDNIEEGKAWLKATP